MNRLEITGLSKRFGDVEVLRDISVSVGQRDFLAVVGPSGCGKSTLVRILAGLETHSEGTVLLDGKPFSGPGPDRGMVFQKYTLFPWLTVKENIMFGLTSQGSSRVTAESEALQWADMIGLGKFTDHYPHQLSGGMQQRVAIARSLAPRPSVLLMDEPFGALDAQTRRLMQQHLVEIWKHVDITIVFITHDLDEALFLAERVLVLRPHPGEIEDEVTVSLPRPRDPHGADFRELRDSLDALIHHDSELEELPLHLLKMTPVGEPSA